MSSSASVDLKPPPPLASLSFFSLFFFVGGLAEAARPADRWIFKVAFGTAAALQQCENSDPTAWLQRNLIATRSAGKTIVEDERGKISRLARVNEPSARAPDPPPAVSQQAMLSKTRI